MTSAILTVLTRQASDGADMPAAAQMGAWNVGLRAKHMPLLRALVARHDLDRDVAYRAASHPSVALRADLCAREDADAALITAAIGDKPTASMLSALCRYDLPEESPVYGILTARMADKPTDGLARAIVNAPVPDGELITAATWHLLDGGDAQSACTQYAAHSLAYVPETAIAILDRLIADGTPVTWLGPLLAVPGLGAERQHAAVAALVAPLAAVAAEDGHANADAWNAFVTAVHAINDPARDWDGDARAAALALVAGLPGDRYEVARLRDAFGIDADGEAVVKPTTGRLFAAARKVRTLEALHAFTAKHNDSTDYARGLGVIAAGTDVPRDVVIEACCRLAWEDSDGDEFRAALTHLGGDIDALNTVYSSDVTSAVAMDGWRAYPSDGPQHYLRHLAGQDPDTRRRDTMRLLSSAEHDDALWQAVSWADVERLILDPTDGAFGDRMQVTAMRAVAHWQVTVFAGSPQHWETFDTLSGDFTGTLGDLLTASATV